MYVSAPHAYLRPTGARGSPESGVIDGCEPILWKLGFDSGSFARSISILNHCTVAPAPRWVVLKASMEATHITFVHFIDQTSVKDLIKMSRTTGKGGHSTGWVCYSQQLHQLHKHLSGAWGELDQLGPHSGSSSERDFAPRFNCPDMYQ